VEIMRRHSGPAGPLLWSGLVTAVLGAAAVVVLYLVAVVDAGGRGVDHALMRAAMRAGAGVREELLGLLDLVSVGSVALVIAGLAAVAVLRGRPRRALAVVAIVLGSQAVTQLLKAGLPREGGAENSLPSGHVTVVASVVVAGVLVLPALLRPLAAIAGTVAVGGAGLATMVVGWHRPSDVLAAVGVVATVTGLVTVVGALTTHTVGTTTGGPTTAGPEPFSPWGPARRPGAGPAPTARMPRPARGAPVPPAAPHARTTVPLRTGTAPR
jgi:membrane-associated phospholipid phosphatase